MALTESTHLGQAQHLIGALIAHGLLQKNLPEEQYLNLWDVVGKHVKVICGEAERAASAPLLARITELEFNFKDMSNRRTKYLDETVSLKERIAALTAQVEQAAQPVAERWHVGDSAFESWYDQYLLDAPVHQGAKQKARDAYAAGMGERAATAPPKAVPLTPERIHDLWASENGLEDCDMCKLTEFTTVVRFVEQLHGITPATVEKGDTP